MDFTNIAAIFILGAAVGVLMAWLIWKNRLAQAQKAQELLIGLTERYAAAQQEIENQGVQAEQGREREMNRQSEIAQLMSERVKLETEKIGLEAALSSQLEERNKLELRFTKEFENLANRIFQEKSTAFISQNKLSLDAVLSPLRERILEFQKKVEDTHTASLTETTNLRLELKQLKETSARMSKEAENLTNALKNDSKTQGNWGEMMLDIILQNSGLVKGREYETQKSFTTEDGRRYQPDVVIKLPEEKYIIIDSKVSLTHYERQNAEEDPLLRDQFLKEHIASIRNHIRLLADKNYQDLGQGYQLDFILMFVPIEAAYVLALDRDPSLFTEAYEKHIVLTSPSTLLASLRIIRSTWKHENQNKNSLEIAQRGKLLLDKFVNFTDDLRKIGEHLGRSEKAYTDAISKLSEGKGSLVNQAKQLEELGVKSNKKLDDHFLRLSEE